MANSKVFLAYMKSGRCSSTVEVRLRRIFIPATVSANRVPTLSSSGEKQIWSEPEDHHQPRSSDKVQLSRRKRLVGGGLNRRIIDYNGKNPLEDRRSLYNSMKAIWGAEGIAFQSANGKSKGINEVTSLIMAAS
ncbi:hypothetical protein YC2023_076149 [Brassica napus]